MARKILQQMFIAVVLTLSSGALFAAYLLLVGIPRTQARQLYLEAESAVSQQEYPQATELLQSALQQWPEAYIKSRLDALQTVN